MTWTPQQEECRLIGHAWFIAPSDWTPKFGGVPFTLRCERCTMERRDAVGVNTGEIVYRRYLPSEGYYLEPDEPHPTRDDLRLDWVERQIKDLRATSTARRGSKKKQKGAAA